MNFESIMKNQFFYFDKIFDKDIKTEMKTDLNPNLIKIIKYNKAIRQIRNYNYENMIIRKMEENTKFKIPILTERIKNFIVNKNTSQINFDLSNISEKYLLELSKTSDQVLLNLNQKKYCDEFLYQLYLNSVSKFPYTLAHVEKHDIEGIEKIYMKAVTQSRFTLYHIRNVNIPNIEEMYMLGSIYNFPNHDIPNIGKIYLNKIKEDINEFQYIKNHNCENITEIYKYVLTYYLNKNQKIDIQIKLENYNVINGEIQTLIFKLIKYKIMHYLNFKIHKPDDLFFKIYMNELRKKCNRPFIIINDEMPRINEVLINVVDKYKSNLKYIKNHNVKNINKIYLKSVSANPSSIKYIKNHKLPIIYEIYKIAMNKNPSLFKYIRNHHVNNIYNIYLKAIEKNYKFLGKMRNHRIDKMDDIYIKCLNKNPNYIKFVKNHNVKNILQLYKIALDHDINNIKYIKRFKLFDKTLMNMYLNKIIETNNFKYIRNYFFKKYINTISTKEYSKLFDIFNLIVNKNGFDIRYIVDYFSCYLNGKPYWTKYYKDEFEIIFETAITQNPYSIRFIKSPSNYIVNKALSLNPFCKRYISDKIFDISDKNTKQIYSLLDKSWKYIKYIDLQDESFTEICKYAIDKDYRSIKYILNFNYISNRKIYEYAIKKDIRSLNYILSDYDKNNFSNNLSDKKFFINVLYSYDWGVCDNDILGNLIGFLYDNLYEKNDTNDKNKNDKIYDKIKKQITKKLEKICEKQGIEWYFKYVKPTKLTFHIRRMCMKAIQNRPQYLKYIPLDLLNQNYNFTKHICLEAVSSDSSTIEYVNPELLNSFKQKSNKNYDKNCDINLISCLYFMAISNNHLLIKFVNPKYITEIEYISLVKIAIREETYTDDENTENAENAENTIKKGNLLFNKSVDESYLNHPKIKNYHEYLKHEFGYTVYF